MRGRKILRDPLTGRFMSRSKRSLTRMRNRRRRMRALPEGRISSSVFERTNDLINVLTTKDSYSTAAKRYLSERIMFFRINVIKNEDIYTLADDLDLSGPFRTFQGIFQGKLEGDNDIETFVDENMSREEASFILFVLYRLVNSIKGFKQKKDHRNVSAPLIDDAIQELTEDVSDSDRREVIDNYFYELA